MGMEKTMSHEEEIAAFDKKWGATPVTDPNVIEGMKEYWAIVNKK